MRILLILLALSPAVAAAEIYKHVGPDGRVTYTNTPMKGAQKLDLEPLNTIAPPPAPKPRPTARAPSDFPRVAEETQRQRDDTRRRILEDELIAENKLLDAARRALTEGEATRMGDERNYQKYLDRVQGLRDAVALHERNVDALKRELAGAR